MRPIEELIAGSLAGTSGDCIGAYQSHQPGDLAQVDPQRLAADARRLCVLRRVRRWRVPRTRWFPLVRRTSRPCYQPGIIPTSYSSAFGNLFNSTGPDKGIGVNLNIPLRNRAAQANQVRSDLEYRQAQVALQQTENTITLQVRQAQFAMQQNYAALQAAIAARDYARESLTAEQKKFTYGASTPTLVLQASSNLTHGGIERAERCRQLREVEGEPGLHDVGNA